MTLPEVFYQRIPPKIKINARKMMILGWLVAWLLTTHAGTQNFPNTEKPRVHSAQGSLKSPTPSPSPVNFLSHQIFQLSHSPDSQPPSHWAPGTRTLPHKADGKQASFLRELLHPPLLSDARKDVTISPSSICSAFLMRSLPLYAYAFGEGTGFFALTRNSAVPRAPTGL